MTVVPCHPTTPSRPACRSTAFSRPESSAVCWPRSCGPATIVYCGTLRPGYSHFAQYISELGERGSSTELLMRYGAFVPTGLMHLAFAGTLALAFRSSRLGVLAAILLGLNGLARIGAGYFPCEVGCEKTGSLAALMHSLSAAVGFFVLVVSAVLWGVVFRRIRDLQNLAAYSVVSGILGLAFLLLMVWR